MHGVICGRFRLRRRQVTAAQYRRARAKTFRVWWREPCARMDALLYSGMPPRPLTSLGASSKAEKWTLLTSRLGKESGNTAFLGTPGGPECIHRPKFYPEDSADGLLGLC